MPVHFDKQGPVVVLTLDRPEKRNAFDSALTAAGVANEDSMTPEQEAKARSAARSVVEQAVASLAHTPVRRALT